MTASAPESDLITATTQPHWTRSPGFAAAATAALTLAAIGLVAGRIDVVLLALPLVAAVGIARDRLPRDTARARATVALLRRGANEVSYRFSVQAPGEVETMIVRYRVMGGASHQIVVAHPPSQAITANVPVRHSGPQELVRFDYRFLSADGLAGSEPDDPIIGERAITPSRHELGALPLPRRLPGLIGTHESARRGYGGEFRDVNLFSPGDRLRRIDWKATARHGRGGSELYARRTNAVSDTTIVIIMDSRDDVGEQIAEWGPNRPDRKGLSALDVAREAASSLAAAYIEADDRVGFQDLSSRNQMVGHSAGQRHLWRLLRSIESTAPAFDPARRIRPPLIPSGALIYLLSSLLDDDPILLALRWRGAGHRVIAVDVLPPARFDRSTADERTAHRIVMMEREDRIELLRSRGVELLAWRHSGTALPVEAHLALLSRPRRRLGSAGPRR